MHQHTWIELSREALMQNLHMMKSHVASGVKFMFVVKANAYGHGLREILSIAESEPDLVDTYGVHSIEEATDVRACGITKPLFVLGYIPLQHLQRVVELDVTPVVTNIETLQALSDIAATLQKTITVHLKCETGTYRQGVLIDELPRYAEILHNSTFVKLGGMTTHFANIEDTTDHKYAFGQLERFQQFLSRAAELGLSPTLNHVACSAALLLFPQTHFNMVRAGISSYGFWSSKETYLSHALERNDKCELHPVLSWKTIVGHIKMVPPDSYIGYGGTYKTTHSTKLAILPIGYYDGYDRGLSNIGYVLIKGMRAPIRGRVCMNMTIVDVTHIPDIRLEDEVILIGTTDRDAISADTMASFLGTINYEVVTRINPRIERTVV